MARPSKYTPGTVAAITHAITLEGCDRAGWEAGKITESTFYAWMERYPEFAEAVSMAKAEYRDTCPEALVRQANKAFADYLFGRMEKVIVTTRNVTTIRDGHSVTFEEETIQRIPLGVPKWAIERVLGKPLDVLEAVKTLVEAGVLPRGIVEKVSAEVNGATQGIRQILEGAIPDTGDRPSKRGLSPEIAAAIRAHILGIEPTMDGPHVSNSDQKVV